MALRRRGARVVGSPAPGRSNRPGRVDQSIEFPVPDEEGRRRLLQVYARGLQLEDGLINATAKRIEGATGAFIKELMRRAAQFQLERDDERVGEAHVRLAIEEMLHHGGVLGGRLLGASHLAAG